MTRPLPTVLVLEPVDPAGLLRLEQSGLRVVDAARLEQKDLEPALSEAQALIVRSASCVDGAMMDKAPRLEVVGRAGVGLDNIDVAEATRRGIAVVNTPGGNAVAAAELSLGLMLAVMRHLASAHASVEAGRWERHRFVGSELAGKTLGVVGLGRIGLLVAARARAFEMQVVGNDPYLTDDRAAALGVDKLPLDELLRRSDVVSLHVPLTDSTRRMMGAEQIGRMKVGAVLINCARGGLVDEAALAEAIAQGRLAGAGIDTFENEPPTASPLVGLDGVVHSPHLGASTREAKENVSLSLAAAVSGVLLRGDYSAAVNLPFAAAAAEGMAPLLDLARRMGSFQAGLLEGAPSRAEVEIAADEPGEVGPLTQAFLCGLLRHACGEQINMVNARIRAEQLGLSVSEARRPAEAGFPRLLVTQVHDQTRSHRVDGGLLGLDQPRIVRVDRHWIDVEPVGNLLFMRNADVPGVMGKVGSLLGSRNLNIGELRLGRGDEPHQAISVWQVDEPLGGELLAELAALEEIDEVRQIFLDSPPGP